MIGTVTPTIRPISGANMPPALTTMSARDLARARRRCSTVTPVTRPRSVPIATTRVCGRICRAALARARRRARWRGPTGRASRRSAARRRRGRRRSTSAGSGPGPRPREISSSGRPNVLAQPAWRRSSSNRSGLRREPQRTDLVPRRVRPGLGGQAPVQVGAVHHHLGERHRARAAGRRGRPSGTSSPMSARRGRPGRCRSSRARRGGTRSRSRRRRRR